MSRLSAKEYRDVEERIAHVLTLMQDEVQPNISRYARDYNLPYSRLLRRFHGVASRSTRHPTHTALTPIQEAGVCRYLDHMDELGASARVSAIRGAANSILRDDCDDPTAPPKVGRDWPTNFLKRHPEYLKIKQKPISLARKQAQDPEALQDWYNRLDSVIEKYEIQPEDMWNFDETGFNIGVSREKTIVTRDRRRRSFLASAENRDHATLLETVSAVGDSIPPIIILAGAIILEPHLLHLPPNWGVTMTESGYATDETLLLFIEHFHRFTSSRQRGLTRLLLMDNYASHITREILEYCEHRRIVVFTLVPHTSHVCQPLDVGVFQQYKHYHSEALDDEYRSGCENFNRVEFMNSLISVRRSTMTQRNIQSGWRRTGVYPFNPSIVIDALRERIRTPSRSRSSSPPQQTPKTTRQLQSLGRKLKRRQSVVKRTLEAYTHGAEAIAHKADLAIQELARVQKAQHNRALRSQQVARHVQRGGLVYSQHVRGAVNVRQKDQLRTEEEFVFRKRIASQKRYKKEWKAVMATLTLLFQVRPICN